MNSHRLSAASVPFLRRTVVAVLCMTGGISVLAFADGPTQPDPPVPLERSVYFVASADPASSREDGESSRAVREPDCRCGVFHARDIESRIEGHVERWEALTHAAAGQVGLGSGARTRGNALHTTRFVEGVVGFPVAQFRLASDTPGDDTPGDDGAGSD